MPLPPPIARAADLALEATVVGSFSRIGCRARAALFGWKEHPPARLDGHVALVTGASSGLGEAAALGLADLGARVVLLGRSEERTMAARDRIIDATGNDAIEVVRADLADLAQVRAAAAEVTGRHDHLDLLVHNAGTLVHRHERTADGLEVTAQTHVVAPFLLTTLLLPLLDAAPDGRVVTVTSGGMYTARLDVDALDRPPPAGPDDPDFDGVRAYAQAKRAQVVLTSQWADRHGGPTTFHAMHPGWADTAGVRESLPHFHRVLGPVLRRPDEGVATTLWLAGAPRSEVGSGHLWLDRRRRRTVYLPGTATPPGEADRLWTWCVTAAGTPDPTPDPVDRRAEVPHLPIPTDANPT